MTYNKIYFVGFCSEGEEYDKGLNLSKSKEMLINSLQDKNIEYTFYSPRILKEKGYGEFVKEHESAGLLHGSNANMNLVGFCAWKPLILLLELEKVNEGDIVVYRDCNCEKYPQIKDFDHFKNHIDEIMDIVQFDFFMPIGRGKQDTIEQFCKSNVIEELAINKEFTKHFPMLIANFIVCRKSNTTIEILNEWKKYCLVDKYINGEQHGELYPGFLWHTPEQGILSVLISNYVYTGKYNIPKNYPNLMFDNRDITKKIIFDKPIENFKDIVSASYDHYLLFLQYIFIGIFVIFIFFFMNKNYYKNIKKRISHFLLFFKK
jgi:hypothetical protein